MRLSRYSHKNNFEESPSRPDRLDCPTEAVRWLQYFEKLNQVLLAKSEVNFKVFLITAHLYSISLLICKSVSYSN